MNSVILEARDKISDELYHIEDESRVRHVREHLKKNVNDLLKVTLLDLGLTRARIRAISPSKIELEILLQEYPPLFHPLSHTLLIGALRPQSLKKILEYGTCLGVKEFIFFAAALSEKSFLDSKVFASEQIKKHCLLGLEQSAYFSSLPKVTVLKKIEYAQLPKERYLLSAEAAQTFDSNTFSEELCLAIGPERGFTLREENEFAENHFKRVKIARSILRSELACLAALSQLELKQLAVNC